MAVRAANSWYNPDEDECPEEKLLSDFSLRDHDMKRSQIWHEMFKKPIRCSK